MLCPVLKKIVDVQLFWDKSTIPKGTEIIGINLSETLFGK